MMKAEDICPVLSSSIWNILSSLCLIPSLQRLAHHCLTRRVLSVKFSSNSCPCWSSLVTHTLCENSFLVWVATLCTEANLFGCAVFVVTELQLVVLTF